MLKLASPPVGSRSPVLGHAPQLAAARLCLLVLPVAVGGGSPVPYSPWPFGVASAALASPVQSAPVTPVAAMSVAGSPAHACSTVVDSGRESAGVAVQPRVVAPAPVPAFVLAPAAAAGELACAPGCSRRAAPTPSAPLPVARPVVAPTPAVSLPTPSAPARSGGAGLPRLQLPSLAEELLPPCAEVPEATLGQLWRLSESLRALLLVQSMAHGSLPPVPAESLLDGPRDDCLDAADQIALLLAPVLAAPVRGGVGAVGQLDAAVRDLRRYLRAGSGADAIGAAILVVRSVWQTMTGILHALQADRM
ncbi:unnamed protein product [Closterium sp. Naga37s-1]|nr:unnamed protein product [Closterium sp. Naga37s-1]